MITYNKRVARILEDAGIVELTKLRDALVAADQKSRPISSLLVEQKLVDEKTLLGIVGEASKIPPIDLRNVQADKKALESVPQDMAFYYGVYPVSRLGNLLTVALTNPFDVVKLDDLRIVTGCELRPVLTMEEPLKVALDKGYKAGQQAVEQILESMQDKDADVQLKENDEDGDEDKDEGITSEREKSLLPSNNCAHCCMSKAHA